MKDLSYMHTYYTYKYFHLLQREYSSQPANVKEFIQIKK